MNQARQVPSPGGWQENIRALPWLVRGAPRWALLLLGLVLVAAGLFLFVRPLTALQFLGVYVAISALVAGIAELLTPPEDGPRPLLLATGILWILVGLSGLVWWSRDVALFGPVVAIALLVSGGLRMLRFAQNRSWESFAGALVGAAEVLFGVLAFAWPDATLIVTGVLFGGRTVVFGLVLLVRAVAPTTGQPSGASRTRRIGYLAFAVMLLAGAVGTTWLGQGLRQGPPVPDAFYETPATLPGTPGTLIRTGPYQGNLPTGMKGFRIYYTTTNATGEIVASSGILAVSEHATGPSPLITWAHGTVGITRACAPSNGLSAFALDQEPAADQFAALGWAFVATDYPGMGAEGAFPYLIGQGEGRAVLDAARAARQVPGVTLDDRTVIWGHSQGGHSALWAGQLARTYAPDLKVMGTAALSPASSPRALADSVLSHPGAAGASLGIAYVVKAYTDYYPDLSFDQVTVPAGRTLIREAAARCTGQGGTLVTILAGLSIGRDTPLITAGALSGPFGQRLDENLPSGTWDAPLFIGQGESDEVINFSINQKYVATLCAEGTDVEFHGYPGGTHMSVIATGSTLSRDLVKWTQDRLAGRPSTPNCP